VSRRSFALWLAAIAVAALAVRLAYAYLLVGDDPLLGDALQFHLQANALADGKGYVQPFLLRDTGVVRPSADKPPLFPFLEAAVSLLGGRSWQAHHLVGVLAGTGTIAVVGLLGRRVAGPAAGLAAAGIAALYPVLVATDGSLRSESVYALAIALCLLAAVRLREQPSAARAAVLGAAIGVAALARSEALALLVLLALPLAGVRRAAVAGLVCLAVLTPWLARTWIALDHPVLVSTNVGGLLAGANCDTTYSGPLLGQWDYGCLPPPRHENEALESARQRDIGLRYARSHAGRLPVVVAARLGRSFELYRPNQNAHMESFYEGRNLVLAQAGTAAFYALVVLAAIGAVALRRRGGPWLVLLAPAALVVITTVISYGFTRFRVAAEPGLVVLAAVGLLALAQRVTGGESSRSRDRALAASAGS
jgi:4-amino-4-deoxy-L-arabinose transferase-like glycosyltransferase